MRPYPLSILALLLAGCAVGPDYTPPVPQLGGSWKQPAAQFTTATPDAEWWQRFGDPVLAGLMRRMAAGNLDLQVAGSRVAQSEAASAGVAATGRPQLSAAGGYTRARNSEQGLLDPSGNHGQAAYSLWQGGLQASWELDLWGRIKRENEAAAARVAGAQASRDAVFVALAAVLAQQYFRLRGVQDELRITSDNLALLRDTARLTRLRLEQGVATGLEVEQAATQEAEVAARLPQLRQREAELVNAIGLLLAEPPQALAQALRAAPGSAPSVDVPVAVGLPSELAARRPDIRAAEAALHAATAGIGVAEGSFYPRITLSGNLGLQARQLADFGGWDAHQFALGPAISLPLFDCGRLRAMLKLRTAQQQEAALAYRQTVLAAWHEVDDAMGAWQASATRRAHLDEAVAHSRAAWQHAQRQYQQGTVDYLHVLTAQRTLLKNESAAAEGHTAVALALVQLYRALGCGWHDAA